MAAKLYYAYIALSRVFAEIFQKFFLHTVPTIPKLGVLLRCIAWGKNRAILNCCLFAFALKMILNLILKTNLKTISDLKIESESDFQSENDCMFHVTRKSRQRRNLITKSPFMGRKLYTSAKRLSSVKSKKLKKNKNNFIPKDLWRNCVRQIDTCQTRTLTA